MVRPKASSSLAEREMDKAEEQFKAYDDNVKKLTEDSMNKAPIEEREAPKLSQSQIEKSKELYLKPKNAVPCREKFNEKYREDFNFKKEYVQFTAQNHEIIGESIELWTRPFPGMPAEFWKVPVNVPVWGPRYLAEQIKNCTYSRFKMTEAPTSVEGTTQYYGSMAVESKIQRLDALPVGSKRSIFMGATG